MTNSETTPSRSVTPDTPGHAHESATDPPADAGFHVAGLAAMRAQSPHFADAYQAMAAVPWREGPLPTFFKALIYVAVNASATQMHREGTERSIRQALALGATPEQVVEVLQLTSTLGIHACIIGVPPLLEAIDPTGERCIEGIAQSAELSAIKDRFVRQRGYWNPMWNGLLWLSPHYFEAFIAFSSEPWLRGTLAPKYKELVYIATGATVTHQFEPGVRIHVRNALELGATAEEIAEVLQLVSAIGIHACGLGSPILAEELGRTDSAG